MYGPIKFKLRNFLPKSCKFLLKQPVGYTYNTSALQYYCYVLLLYIT